MRAIASDAGVLRCDFIDRRGMADAMAAVLPEKSSVRDGVNDHLVELRSELFAYFEGNLREFTVPLAPVGSDFELRAWAYLRSIPYGETRTYGQQAAALGDVRFARAVGRANGQNFLAILIPCHRVIAASGDLTGYGGGLDRKRWLLDHEADGGLFAKQRFAAAKIS